MVFGLRSATLEDVRYIVTVTYKAMNAYLEKAYGGSFDWAVWEFELRGSIQDQSNRITSDMTDDRWSLVEVIMWNDTPAGFSWITSHKEQALWVDSLIIEPNFRSQGLGGRVVELLPQRFPTITVVELGVQEANQEAVAFYKRHGFYQVPDPAMKQFYTLRMRKDFSRRLE